MTAAINAAHSYPKFPEDTNPKAYVHNALFHLNLLRSTIHDGLTGSSDLHLKVSLLYDLDDAEENLRKALL